MTKGEHIEKLCQMAEMLEDSDIEKLICVARGIQLVTEARKAEARESA